MVLLWINTIVAAGASAILLLWALKWFRRRASLLSALYVMAAMGTLCLAFGFSIVLIGGDPTVSATIARQSVWAAVGIPAIARLIELLREEQRHNYADQLLTVVERRADCYDEKSEESA